MVEDDYAGRNGQFMRSPPPKLNKTIEYESDAAFELKERTRTPNKDRRVEFSRLPRLEKRKDDNILYWQAKDAISQLISEGN